MLSLSNKLVHNSPIFKPVSFKGKDETIIIPDEDNDYSNNKSQIYSPYSEYAYFIPHNYFNIPHQMSEIDIRNQQLKAKYGIESNIKSLKLMDKIEKSIEDFCRINEDNNLFKKNNCQLVLKEDELHNPDKLYGIGMNNNYFLIDFNSDYNLDELKDRTNFMYDCGAIGANNPNYRFYQALGHFLEFSNNPQNYMECNTSPEKLDNNFNERKKIKLLRVGSCDNMNFWKANYIASKMSGRYLPSHCSDNFKALNGNTNLKFPQSQYPVSKYKSNINFSSIDQAEQYLYKRFKIKAQFNNLDYANACTNAVEDLTKAIGNKYAFKNLEIVTITDCFGCFDSPGTVAQVKDDPYISNEKKLYINDNTKASDSICNEDFENGSCSHNNLKGVFIHELAHVLDKNSNDVNKYATMSKSGLSFNEDGKRFVSKVSAYACDNPNEFLAEYVAGRMDGHKYPERVNALFDVLWGGPKINF